VAVVAIAAGLLVFVSMPPARLTLASAAGGDGTLAGILHIHTNRSDGRSAPDDVAAAAARAGLKFVVFTDHGDGTRPPDPPAYRSGVLCIDGVEISTTAGHYVALGLPAAPYPLGGEPRDVVEDVNRLGGFGIAAHPDSPKRELRWGAWDLPIDGLELINPDTSWRVQLTAPGLRPRMRLLAALGTYPFRPGETIAALLGDRSEIASRWDSLTARRRVAGIAGVDAHAKLALWDVEPGDNSFTMPFPGYEPVFRMLSVRVRPDRPFSGDAANDARALIAGIRAGHLYTAVDAIATPPSFEFSASTRDGSIQQGDEISVGGPVSLRVRTNAPPEFTTTIFKDGRAFAKGHHEGDFTVPASAGPAVYRAEVHASNRPGDPLWIFSNPIYVRQSAAPGSPRRPFATTSDLLFPAGALGWSVEHDAGSQADLVTEPGQMIFRYTLGADAMKRPRVALVAFPRDMLPNDRVMFLMRADRPMRISVQLRTGASAPPEERWQRSIYVDTVEGDRTVFFDEFVPVGTTRTERPALTAVPSLLFVVETTNTKPGSSGTLWIKMVALQRPSSGPTAAPTP
jgi:hypothetical protein